MKTNVNGVMKMIDTRTDRKVRSVAASTDTASHPLNLAGAGCQAALLRAATQNLVQCN
ncbi:polysaccharide biosynthesis protein [Janthinobacterium sp. 1_2014MBL_MicDiv]|uniref:polysaccharide biosynthesis protein n=1 Tax=Janthinobacterium sp. 1_2014MBL_MicDiv TaxID=1644131 RepID=UPI0012EC98A8|nr:polysaccharide biosynthesis protein [Janthinobacterium sp. 1_2014MBL_MicDiv]